MLRETTSQGRCELVCPSRTNERWLEGYCVKGGEGEEGERERERASRIVCPSRTVYSTVHRRAAQPQL